MKKILYFAALFYIFSISQHHAMENNGGPSKESQSEFLTQIVPQSQPIIRPSPLTTIEKNKEEASFEIQKGFNENRVHELELKVSEQKIAIDELKKVCEELRSYVIERPMDIEVILDCLSSKSS